MKPTFYSSHSPKDVNLSYLLTNSHLCYCTENMYWKHCANHSNSHYLGKKLFLWKACGFPMLAFSDRQECAGQILHSTCCWEYFVPSPAPHRPQMFLWPCPGEHGWARDARPAQPPSHCTRGRERGLALGLGLGLGLGQPSSSSARGLGTGAGCRHSFSQPGQPKEELGQELEDDCGAEELVGWPHMTGTWHAADKSLLKLKYQVANNTFMAAEDWKCIKGNVFPQPRSLWGAVIVGTVFVSGGVGLACSLNSHPAGCTLAKVLRDWASAPLLYRLPWWA